LSTSCEQHFFAALWCARSSVLLAFGALINENARRFRSQSGFVTLNNVELNSLFGYYVLDLAELGEILKLVERLGAESPCN
jgi:hypothetical protein